MKGLELIILCVMPKKMVKVVTISIELSGSGHICLFLYSPVQICRGKILESIFYERILYRTFFFYPNKSLDIVVPLTARYIPRLNNRLGPR